MGKFVSTTIKKVIILFDDGRYREYTAKQFNKAMKEGDKQTKKILKAGYKKGVNKNGK